MRIKRYLLHVCVGILAFFFGVVDYLEYDSVVAYFRAPEKQQLEVSHIDPLTVEAAPPASIEPETPLTSEGPELPNFDMSGEYEAAEELPRGFKNFKWIYVEMADYENSTEESLNGIPIPPKGSIQLGKEYKFTRIGISGKAMAFETEAINGISYRFTGKFVTDTTADDLPVDLHGHLTKVKNGRKVAETELSLYVGGC